jgi:hypothetical protein
MLLIPMCRRSFEDIRLCQKYKRLHRRNFGKYELNVFFHASAGPELSYTLFLSLLAIRVLHYFWSWFCMGVKLGL